MKATSNEAMAGVADRSFAEKALEEKAKADLSVAEQVLPSPCTCTGPQMKRGEI